jgi:segregation and condensation protein B
LAAAEPNSDSAETDSAVTDSTSAADPVDDSADDASAQSPTDLASTDDASAQPPTDLASTEPASSDLASVGSASTDPTLAERVSVESVDGESAVDEPDSDSATVAAIPPAAEPGGSEVAEPLVHSSTQPDSGSVDEPLNHSSTDPVTGEVAEPLIHSATASESGSSTEPPDAAAADDEGVEDGVLPLSDADFEAALEALLLVVDAPVEEEALATALSTTPLRVAENLRLLSNKYTDQDRGIDLRRAGGGWRFYTRDRYAPYVEKFLLDGQRAKLTRAALETLAVIAYRQPVTRARVAAVRGVNCDGVIRTLLARGLVEETGTDVETGGFLYRTTELFLERLGLSSLDDLPPIAPLLPEVDTIDEL